MMRSNTFPYVEDYSLSRTGNPIMDCLADQSRHDFEHKTHCFTGETLLNAILTDLKTGKLAWPGENFMKSKNWIQNMKKLNNWYNLNTKGTIYIFRTVSSVSSGM